MASFSGELVKPKRVFEGDLVSEPLTVSQEPEEETPSLTDIVETAYGREVDPSKMATGVKEEEGPGFFDIVKALPGALKEGAVEAYQGAKEAPGETISGFQTGIRRSEPYPIKKYLDFTDFISDLQRKGFEKFTGQKIPDTRPDFKEPETEQEKRAARIGEFTGRAGTGLALSTLVPGTGLASTLGQGALAGAPFVEQAFKEGGSKEAIEELIVNTALDAALFGAGKVLGAVSRPVKQAIFPAEKQAVKQTVQQIAKEQGALAGTAQDVLKRLQAAKGEGIETVQKTAINASNDLISDMSSYALANNLPPVDVSDVGSIVAQSLRETPQVGDPGKVLQAIDRQIKFLAPENQMDIPQLLNLKNSVNQMSIVAKDPVQKQAYEALSQALSAKLYQAAPDADLVQYVDVLDNIELLQKNLGEVAPDQFIENLKEVRNLQVPGAVSGAVLGAATAAPGEEVRGGLTGGVGGYFGGRFLPRGASSTLRLLRRAL